MSEDDFIVSFKIFPEAGIQLVNTPDGFKRRLATIK
jgi:hypothetical protein